MFYCCLLIWDNEQAAVKQNFNALIAIAFTMPVALVVIGLSIAVYILNLGSILSCAVHFVLAATAVALLMLMIKKGAEKCYNNIEI